MTSQGVVGITLLLAGSFLGVPVAVVLGIVVLLFEGVRLLWSRRGLADIHYTRRLGRDRLEWGDTTSLTVSIWNRRRLPLAWLRADDAASTGVVVSERPLVLSSSGERVLRNVWTLAPFERVVREFHVRADRRGVFELGPVALEVGDLFAREAASGELTLVDHFLVRPRTVAAPILLGEDRWGGADRAHAGLSEDPSRFAGVREYAPGDPIRRIHPRASARLGRPVVKRFEPSRDREVLIALDVQTSPGPSWSMDYDVEAVEALYVTAASIARSLLGTRAAVGLTATGYSGVASRFASLPVSAAPGQTERVLDLLARLSSHPSAPFERLLGMVARTVRPGTTVVVLTARDPSPFIAHLRGIQRRGASILVVTCGPQGPADAARARAAGLTARCVRLDGPWRTAERLAVVA
jgi:Uncharacterized conserved protein (some members contain a von Willebrand factor type A (vWA) domain)